MNQLQITKAREPSKRQNLPPSAQQTKSLETYLNITVELSDAVERGTVMAKPLAIKPSLYTCLNVIESPMSQSQNANETSDENVRQEKNRKEQTYCFASEATNLY